MSKCGEPRTNFPESLVDVPDPNNGGVSGFVVPCILHAWLRLANQRIAAIGNRCARKDRGHTAKDAEKLFHILGLPFWTKTKTNDHFFFATRAIVDRIVRPEVDEALADFEGLTDRDVWRRWYDLFAEAEKGVKPNNYVAFKERANLAVATFVKEYSAEQLHVYQHIIAEHAVAVRIQLGDVPLEVLANQRAETSHHEHKMQFTRHTFGNGARLVHFDGEGEHRIAITQRAAPLAEVVARDLTLKLLDAQQKHQ